MLSVTYKPFMLSVIMLNVVMLGVDRLSVAVPFTFGVRGHATAASLPLIDVIFAQLACALNDNLFQ
jgi:hypothetical protein